MAPVALAAAIAMRALRPAVILASAWTDDRAACPTPHGNASEQLNPRMLGGPRLASLGGC